MQEKNHRRKIDRALDRVAMHPILGYIVFFALLFSMFELTFTLGEYPKSWIQYGVDCLATWVQGAMEEGPVKDLIINGAIAGVGGVIVFLPNILILFLIISFLERSGYMSRAASLMDGLMHRFGLSGYSFIPLIMGFGCNVPAIMATQNIKDNHSRMITILINPLMSCSARLPVYIFLAGTFFPKYASIIIFSLYLLGIALALLISTLIRRFIITDNDIALDLSLHRYRLPSFKETFLDIYEKTTQYLKKMGGVILIASIFIWFLTYYPREGALNEKDSYIGKIGQVIEPIMRPLGFDWKMSTSLLSGIAGKELIISTMGVLYSEDRSNESNEVANLSKLYRESILTYSNGNMNKAKSSALAYMVFVLIYFPCIPTLSAIQNETKHAKWVIFSIIYTSILAYSISYISYQMANWLL